MPPLKKECHSNYYPAREVHFYRKAKIGHEYITSLKWSYVSTSSLGRRRCSITHIQQLYHSSLRGV
ncbi:hypothetical protein B9Z19DRAFT_1085070 [Tuber borchii]|uniref:Uncharacterized protein n=1 Tax=Tuber borchii TaxID=42251 RepID=A0A2T6ZRE9_TUBBO|nr:hypothetical protein B9Z19DRAFT_1085070 [Tuber borchii]